ncbi:hypothetical protein BGY98DRAFT_1099623 [Russula aff. rugulosa BPL654]|nr:hypothetical protein BGY98DRAFT_1099623 [Russula aff. rugulosa BPL654]
METRKTRKKRSQKDASISEPGLGKNTTTPTDTSNTAEGEKKRKTIVPPADSTPQSPKQTYNFNFASQTSPLMEDSFCPQMTSPSPGGNPTFPLEFELANTTSETINSSPDTSVLDTSTTSLKDRVIAAKERGTKINTNSTTTKDPIDKYTNAEMPIVHYSHPTTALDFIDVEQIGDWDNLLDRKLLAHPFGHKVKNTRSHQTIKANLFAAVIEITQSETVGICSLHPCSSARGIPIIFLIYNILELHRRMLLKRVVWSSVLSMFRITTLDPVRPDYLFSITGLTNSATEVEAIVRKVWDFPTSLNFLEAVTNTYPSDKKLEIKQSLEDHSKSMWIQLLDTKNRGGAAAPTFNVYAKGNFITKDGLWCIIRNHLTAQDYATPFQDPGIARADIHRCSICHSIDHPRGLCRFPTLKGWNGPVWDDPNLKQSDDNKKYNPARKESGSFH